MPRARAFEALEFTARFERSYLRLSTAVRAQCDEALLQLQTDPITVGLHLKPIRPSKRFWEARINRGDRLILLPERGTAYVFDVVRDDDIARWGGRV